MGDQGGVPGHPCQRPPPPCPGLSGVLVVGLLQEGWERSALYSFFSKVKNNIISRAFSSSRPEPHRDPCGTANHCSQQRGRARR